MKRYSLHNPFLVVENGGDLSYGGNQNWSKSKTVQKCGCGAIGGTDLLLYLSLNKERCRTEVFKQAKDSNGILELEEYLQYVDYMRKRYLFLFPHFGMPGWVLAGGINRYLARYHTGLRATWGVRTRNLWNRISAMLSHDIPVILSIGPNFPFVWKKKKLTLYQKTGREGYIPVNEVCAHYVTVTEMDEVWLRVSFWGREYYINRLEYMNYVKKTSIPLVSNICYIRKG